MVSLNVSAMSPSMVHSIVDAFFDVKKVEMKQRLQLEVDRMVEDMFGELVGQVKQLLVPGTSQVQQTQQVPQPKQDCPKSFANVTQEPSSRNIPMPELQEKLQKEPPESNLPKRKFFAVKSLPRPSSSNQNDTSVKRTSPNPISDISTTRADEPNHVKSSTIKVEISYANEQNCPSDKSASEHDQSHRSLKRQRVDSAQDHKLAITSSFTPASSGNSKSMTPAAKFGCSTCGKQFKKNFDLKRHQRIHLGVKPYVCKWPGCSYSAQEVSPILKHVRNVHLKQSGKKADETDAQIDQKDPKEFIEVVKELLN